MVFKRTCHYGSMQSHEQRYEIQSKKPLEALIVKQEQKEGFTLKWLRINGQLEEPISALLLHRLKGPTGKLLLFLHGLNGMKEDLILLKEIAEAFEFSLFAIDARRHGERRRSLTAISPSDIIEGLSGTIADNRLAIDVALRNGWAENGKIILVGSSMGGILGGVVAGVDKRIAGAVLYVPGGNLAEIMAKSKESTVMQATKGIPSLLLRILTSQLGSIDPINYIDKISPRPVLIQIGKHDDVVPFETAMKLFNAAKEPKDLVVHDSGHSLPMDRAMYETIRWMRREFPLLMS